MEQTMPPVDPEGRAGRLVGQYRRLLQAVLCEVLRAVERDPPGLERIARAVGLYFDTCFVRRRALRRLLLALRDLSMEGELLRSAPMFLLRADLAKLGVAAPDATAESLMQRVDQLRDRECAVDCPDPAARARLLELIRQMKLAEGQPA
ncbi:MAG TPA: hypothetical protein VLI06_00920 [Solimonas sp.]|nr:hypothetical protein [Solimonas sp.]